jgi:Family of unknown function (DUF5995)
VTIAPVPVHTVADVIQTLTNIDGSLSEDDGLKWFNLLYLRVTKAIDSAVDSSHFQDPQWIASLDVVFANLYFQTVRAAETGTGVVPAAWQPLFDARKQAGIYKIQYALAGMNAHINRDLPVALVQLAAQTTGYPSQASTQFQDFQAVNPLLETVEKEFKEEFLTDVPDLPGLTDMIAMWSVERARETAWGNGGILWHLQPVPHAADAFLDGLDHTIGLVGRGFLIRI